MIKLDKMKRPDPGIVLILILQITSGITANCTAGFYHIGTQCIPCDIGTYKEAPGSHNCTICPPDEQGKPSTTRGTAATNKYQCFFEPHISWFEPKRGPLTGGTLVNITIPHLDRRNVTEFSIGEVRGYYENQGHEWISVITGPTKVEISASLVVYLTDVRGEYVLITREEEFSYIFEPIITNIENLGTILSGGIVLRVRGENFNETKTAIMVITRVFKEEESQFYSECDIWNSTTMLCPTPDLTDSLVIGWSTPTLQKEETDSTTRPNTVVPNPTTTTNPYRNYDAKRKKRSEDNALISTGDIVFFLGFELDGIRKYGNFTTLPVYKDPVFYKFDEEDYVKEFRPSKETFLHIKGKHLDRGISISDVTVTIGLRTCKITALVTNELTCIPPKTKPPSGDPGTPFRKVEVRVGRLVQVVGYLSYQSDSTFNIGPILVAFVVLGLFVLWVFVLWITVTWFCPRKDRIKRLSRHIISTQPPDVTHSQSSLESDAGFLPYRETRPRGSDTGESSGSSSLPTEVTDVDILDDLDDDIRALVADARLDPDSLQLEEVIASGKSSVIYSGSIRSNPEDTTRKVSIKMIRPSSGDRQAGQLSIFLEDCLILKGLTHVNLVQLYGVVIHSDELPMVVVEHMDRGNLRFHVASDPNISRQQILHYSTQICEGMAYLETNRVIHKDLAARNCQINSEEVVKVADPGLSRDLYEEEYCITFEDVPTQPLRWRAPECVHSSDFSTKSDVWAYGVVLWELFSQGSLPYATVEVSEIISFLRRGNRAEKPPDAPRNVYEMMKSCWAMDPGNRPSFSSLLAKLGEMETLSLQIEDVPFVK